MNSLVRATCLFSSCLPPLARRRLAAVDGAEARRRLARDGILDKFPKGGPKELWRDDDPAATAAPPSPTARSTSWTASPTPTRRQLSEPATAQPRSRARSACSASTRRTARRCGSTSTTARTRSPTPPGRAARRPSTTARSTRSAPRATCTASTRRRATVLWSKDFKKDYGAKTAIWGYASHPLVDGKKLICVVGGKGSVAVAFDKDTGKEMWKAVTAARTGLFAADAHHRRRASGSCSIWDARQDQQPRPGERQGVLDGRSEADVRHVDHGAAAVGRRAVRRRPSARCRRRCKLSKDGDKLAVEEVWRNSGNRDTSVVADQHDAVRRGRDDLRRRPARAAARRWTWRPASGCGRR